MITQSRISPLKQYVSQQTCPEWRFFLMSFLEVIGDNLTTEECREFLRKVGENACSGISISTEDTLMSANDKINQFWHEQKWGFCKLFEENEKIYIEHFLSPLYMETNSKSLDWLNSFFEGIYSGWLNKISELYSVGVYLTKVRDSSDYCLMLECTISRKN